MSSALLLGLAAAIVGGLLGVPGLRTREREIRGPRVRPVEPMPRGPVVPAPPRQAYPRP